MADQEYEGRTYQSNEAPSGVELVPEVAQLVNAIVPPWVAPPLAATAPANATAGEEAPSAPTPSVPRAPAAKSEAAKEEEAEEKVGLAAAAAAWGLAGAVIGRSNRAARNSAAARERGSSCVGDI